MLIRCLGPVSLQHEDGETHLSRSQRHLVALLAAAGPNGLTTDRIADEMYGEDLTPGWEGSVRKAISRLRRKVGVQEIANLNGRYALRLPSDQVDLWTLLDIESLDLNCPQQDTMHDLLSGQPFGGVELSPLLRESEEAIATARLVLLKKLGELRSQPLGGRTLLGARTFAVRSLFREDVLTQVLELHLAADQIALAQELAAKAKQAHVHDAGLGLSPAIETLISRIESRSPDATTRPVSTPGNVATPGRIVGMYEPAVGASMIDRPALRDDIKRHLVSAGALVSGESGSGKSALVQSAVPSLADTGRHVLWLTGRRGSISAYQSFLAAIPALEHDLAPIIEDGGNELLRMKCWGGVRRRLATEFSDLPLVLVVDDAQWLDSHSQALLIFLCSTHADSAPKLLAIGRDDPSSGNWEGFSKEILSIGATPIEVATFDHDQLLELIGLYHPTSTSKQRHDFAAALVAQRAALPVIAHQLIQSADPQTLALSNHGTNVRTTGLWVAQVANEPRQVAATAAAIGMRFRLETVAKLTDFDIDSILDASEILVQSGIWVSEQRLDEFSFRHVLIHADFDSALTRAERARLHLRLGEEAEERGDRHTSASHFLEAGVLAGNDRVVTALLASARLLQQQGSYREAVDAYSHASRLADEQLATQDLLHYSAAVSSSGGDGWDLRAAAFERALETGDADQCLEVAVHGVLATENVLGQVRRVKMLERVPADQLTDRRRAEHAAALARELGLLGEHERAIETAATAMNMATEPDDRFTAWLGAWASVRALPPATWPQLPTDRHLVQRPELVSRLAQVELGLALVRGDDGIARDKLDEFARHPATAADPLRAWHAGLAETTMLFIDGDWDASRQAASRTFAVASEQGVTAAFSTRLAQEFMLQWIVGQHGALLPQFDTAAPDVHDTPLAQAAFATILAEHDDQQHLASSLVAKIANQALKHQAPLSPGTAVLLASTPGRMRSVETNSKLQQILEPFLGSAMVPGAALSHLGPTSWSLSKLAADQDRKIELLQQACAESERWNLRLWSVVCLRDLAALTNDASLAAGASEAAAGTQLEMLL